MPKIWDVWIVRRYLKGRIKTQEGTEANFFDGDGNFTLAKFKIFYCAKLATLKL